MTYTQDTTYCFADGIGENGLKKDEHQNYMHRLIEAQKKLKAERTNGNSYLNITAKTSDLEELQTIADKYRAFDNVVIFGTGGSSLGAEALHQISDITKCGKGAPKLHIITNIDPYTYLARFRKMDLTKTGFIVISKSGGTVETIMQFLTVLPLLEKEIPRENFKDIITLIAEPGDNPLRRLGKKYDLTVLDHDPNLGGRYSVFSLVGVLPALIVGLSGLEFRQGADEVLEHALNTDLSEVPSAIGASIAVGLLEKHNINITVLLAYSDRLGSLARWYRQLWAESLGKKGKGSTPIYGMGPVDQHSQLQLWLEGPKDKVFTVLRTKIEVKTTKITSDALEGIGMDFLKDHSLNELMQESCDATTETLWRHSRPTRVIDINEITVKSMGALMMHFVLETVFSAHLLDVNPFNQPAVEHGKKIMRASLENKIKS